MTTWTKLNPIKRLEHNYNVPWYQIIWGILLCLALAAGAWQLGKLFPVVGGPIVAIVAGILISAIFPRLTTRRFSRGISLEYGLKFTSKELLRYAVVLLGFSLNFYSLIQVGGQTLMIMLVTMSLAFLTAAVGGRLLKLPGKTTTLIGVGTAVCGASAIAAAAPVIQAEDKDVGQAISTIFLFNIIGALIFPTLGLLMQMTDFNFGTWAGTAITDTSSVVAAGAAWSNATGSDVALQIGTIAKLTRALTIVPICLVLAVIQARQHRQQGGSFHLAQVFPWFVLAFVLAATVNTFAGLPTWLSADLTEAGKFVIIMAMAAIGLNTNIQQLFAHGVRPILLGAACWLVLTLATLLILSFGPLG